MGKSNFGLHFLSTISVDKALAYKCAWYIYFLFCFIYFYYLFIYSFRDESFRSIAALLWGSQFLEMLWATDDKEIEAPQTGEIVKVEDPYPGEILSLLPGRDEHSASHVCHIPDSYLSPFAFFCKLSTFSSHMSAPPQASVSTLLLRQVIAIHKYLVTMWWHLMALCGALQTGVPIWWSFFFFDDLDCAAARMTPR